MAQAHLQRCWKFRLVSALVISGAIASSGGYTLAQTPCLPGQLCVLQTLSHQPHSPNPRAFPSTQRPNQRITIPTQRPNQRITIPTQRPNQRIRTMPIRNQLGRLQKRQSVR
ncbi:hypothetical protein [Scytonema sp. PCC 10023]|uniref:hypothetical protein n=1 Tax=Scytonema sp. PCC 10023 TaxID=1680591 RepID=UPI0039C6AC3D